MVDIDVILWQLGSDEQNLQPDLHFAHMNQTAETILKLMMYCDRCPDMVVCPHCCIAHMSVWDHHL